MALGQEDGLDWTCYAYTDVDSGSHKAVPGMTQRRNTP